MHSQSATEQPAGLEFLAGRRRPGCRRCAWSSPVRTMAAFSPRGRYQKRGSGALSRFISVIRFASSRCCSSAWGTSILLMSTQSGWTSPALAP